MPGNGASVKQCPNRHVKRLAHCLYRRRGASELAVCAQPPPTPLPVPHVAHSPSISTLPHMEHIALA